MYYKRNDGKAWHGPGVITGIDGKIVLVRHEGSMLRVSPVHLLPVRDADKQRADDTLSHSGQDGLPQSGKIPESLSCNKGEQTDMLVTIDDVINDEDTGLHVPEDPFSGTGSALNGIPINSVAPFAHDETCDTESEISDGDASSHVVVDDHMNETEHVISTINIEQTDFIQEESIACATSNPPFPSSPAHSPNQRDVFSHHTDSIDNTSHDEFVIQASSTNPTPAFFSECNPDNSPSDHPSGKTESTLMPATNAKCKEGSYSSSASVRTSDIVRFVDSDTKENGRFLVVSWAGKAQGQYHNWFHVKNLDNCMLKSVDFSQVEWSKAEEKVYCNATNSVE